MSILESLNLFIKTNVSNMQKNPFFLFLHLMILQMNSDKGFFENMFKVLILNAKKFAGKNLYCYLYIKLFIQ